MVMLAAGAGAVLIWIGLSSKSPIFLKNGGPITFTCYGGDPKGEIIVRSTDEGRSADVTFQDRTYRLPYTGSFFFTDYYSDGSISMSLDPEARLDGFPGGPGGLCAI
jgi:hypothetical protein